MSTTPDESPVSLAVIPPPLHPEMRELMERIGPPDRALPGAVELDRRTARSGRAGGMIRHLDLFSGIGGFALAVRWLGGESVGFCEIDPWCRRILAKNFPGVPIHDDIQTLTGDALARFEHVDLVTGGYPCQPFSVAGNRRGKEDDRYLWPAMAAVIGEARPTYVLVENSPNIRTMVLDDMCDDLEDLGYAVRACVVPACAVGALHQRDRMWTLAHIDGEGEQQPAGGLAEERVGAGDGPSAAADAHGRRRRPGQRDLQAREPGAPDDPASPPADAYGGRCVAPTDEVRPGRHTAVHGLGWPTRPGLLRRVHGVPRRVDRVRGLGNAIVPQVAYELLRVMIGSES